MKNIHFAFLVIVRLLNKYIPRPKQRRFELPKSNTSHLFLNEGLLKRLAIFLAALVVLGVIGIRIKQIWNSEITISEGMVGIYTYNNLPLSVLNLLSLPLVTIDRAGQFTPSLAQSWQVNNDATIYTFKLKKDLYWNDGQKLRSSDIKFSLPDVEVNYPDDESIEFKLADAYGAFPALLTTPVLRNHTNIGVGNYSVVYENINKSLITKLILEPNTNNTALPTLIVRFYPDERTMRTAFDIGEINTMVVSDITDFYFQKSLGVKDLINHNKIVAVFYNTQDPLLSDKNLRKSMGLSIPKIDGEELTKSPVVFSSWAYNDSLKEMVNNPVLAKSYFDKVESGKDQEIVLTTIPGLSGVGERIVSAWKKLGINAILRIESGMPQNFQALLTSQTIPTDPDQYLLWHSTQTKTNLSKYNSKRVDKDLEDGRKSSDIEKRKERYLDFQKVLSDDLPASFLYFPKSHVIFRKKIKPRLEQVLPLQIPG